MWWLRESEGVLSGSTRERALFGEEGYLILEDLLSPEELAAAHAEVARLHGLSEELADTGDAAARHFQREPYVPDSRHASAQVLRKI